MPAFATLCLPEAPTVIAPDGSTVRVLLSLAGGSMAHFSLRPGQVAAAVCHRSVEELWWILEGRGTMWRRQDGQEGFTELRPGVCLSLPVGTDFQFRADPQQGLSAVAVTLPPWPGPDEARQVSGPWVASP